MRPFRLEFQPGSQLKVLRGTVLQFDELRESVGRIGARNPGVGIPVFCGHGSAKSERGRPRHDDSVGVIEDHPCYIRRGWFSRVGFLFLFLLVHVRRRAFPKLA
jgi:hypothetical protein